MDKIIVGITVECEEVRVYVLAIKVIRPQKEFIEDISGKRAQSASRTNPFLIR
jgi:hypothetical protein